MVFIMVIGTENNKFSHTHNIVNFIPPVGGRPLKCLPIAHQIFQSPQASGRPLRAHPRPGTVVLGR